MKILCTLMFFLLSSISFAQIERPFVTDSCTGYPEGTKKNPTLWEDCCKTHDLYFWAGGNKSQRKTVDKELRSCIKSKGGKFHATIMYLGVSIGGLSPIKFGGKQWGNAWGKKTRKTKLSEPELAELKHSLELESDLDVDQIENFILDLIQRNR
jgi:hypothetical protein